jgi:hypothetical protein
MSLAKNAIGSTSTHPSFRRDPAANRGRQIPQAKRTLVVVVVVVKILVKPKIFE